MLNFDGLETGTDLRDAMVQAAATRERLRPVTRDEFHLFWRTIWTRKFKKPVVAFGNTARGDSEAQFAGVPYIDVDGQIKVIENWTRGMDGDSWSSDWSFLLKEL